MLHISKVKASEQEFEIIYEQSGLKPQFKRVFFEVLFSQNKLISECFPSHWSNQENPFRRKWKELKEI